VADYNYFMEKNDSEDDEKWPLAVVSVYSDGSLSISGRADMSMREVAALLHIVSHDMVETLDRREEKAKEN